MENRFGFKELVLSALMIAILIAIFLHMRQVDRHWGEMKAIQASIEDQTTELKRMTQLLSEGVRVRGGTQQAATNAGATGTAGLDDTFPRLLAARAEPDFAEGDWYIDAFGATVKKITPLTSGDVYGSIIQGYVLQTLAERDPDTLDWKPLLAESWTISDDGLTITFKLRDDARFSDGKPVTCEDVLYSYELIMNPEIAAPRARAYYEKIKSVTIDEGCTVTFVLEEPYFKGFDIAAGLEVLAKHWYSQFTPEQFNEMPGLLFGSGPYKLSGAPEQWQAGTGKIELVRNDNYWGVAPAFNKIVYREITDETAKLVAFRNGEIDVFNPRPEQYLDLKNDQELLETRDLYEYETVTGGYRYVGWNQQRDGKPTLFADKRVRQALAMLTDRKRMTEELMVGLATVTTGPFHRLSKQSTDDVSPWSYDPKAARKLLAEAGFEDRDGDGLIESPEGKPFIFKLIYPSGIINYQQMAFSLKDSYARAGIKLEPDPLEWTIMQQRMDSRDFDAMTLGWSGSIESDPYQIFHSKQIRDGGDNYVHYNNPKLDELIETARVTMNEDERMEMWHEVHKLLHEDQPYLFLWTSRAVVFVDDRMHNVQRVKTGLNPREEWFVPMPEQKWGQ